MKAITLFAKQLLVKEDDASSAMIAGLIGSKTSIVTELEVTVPQPFASVATILKAVDSVIMPGA